MSEKYAGLTALQENVVKTKEHVESVRAVLDAQKANVFTYSTIPQNPTEGMIIMWVGADTQNMSKGGWYQYTEVTPSTNPPTYYWKRIDSSSITVDTALSTSSTNPVQNKVITTNLATKQNSALSTAIGGQTTVEDCLTALNNRVKATYDSNGSWVEVEVTLP